MEDEQYIIAYSRFRNQLRQINSLGDLMAYDWLSLPESIPGIWMAYFEMVKDHSHELANVINQLLTNIEKLSAWDKVLLEYGTEDRFYIVHEFVDPLGTICLNLPYAIRSRFIFSVTHISHQANRVILGNEWRDNLPLDAKIDFSTMDKLAANWKSYKKLKLSIECLSDKKHQAQVNHYRHKYHHRYPSHIEFGLSEMVKRIVNDNGTVVYAFGYNQPLHINDIVLELKEQHEAAARCFTGYQHLVKEQIERIINT
jgi:hypothetical protein